MHLGTTTRAGLAAAATLLAGPALAHTGIGDAHGFSHGLTHPIGGPDHVLAMVAVGLLAAERGGRALWALPLAFVLMMATGAALGAAGARLPGVETAIGLSVVLFGLAVALRVPLPGAAGAALVGGFALFHGHAHGAEMPADASGLAYGAGFVLATAGLHGAGIALGFGLAAARPWFRWLPQVAGAGIALGGLAILAG